MSYGRERYVSDDEARRSDLVDIAAEVRVETPMAWKLYDGSRCEWVPKSIVEDNHDGTFAMPEWLAKEKGFI